MGTHPIFESDFDCLTDRPTKSRCRTTTEATTTRPIAMETTTTTTQTARSSTRTVDISTTLINPAMEDTTTTRTKATTRPVPHSEAPTPAAVTTRFLPVTIFLNRLHCTLL